MRENEYRTPLPEEVEALDNLKNRIQEKIRYAEEKQALLRDIHRKRKEFKVFSVLLILLLFAIALHGLLFNWISLDVYTDFLYGAVVGSIAVILLNLTLQIRDELKDLESMEAHLKKSQ